MDFRALVAQQICGECCSKVGNNSCSTRVAHTCSILGCLNTAGFLNEAACCQCCQFISYWTVTAAGPFRLPLNLGSDSPRPTEWLSPRPAEADEQVEAVGRVVRPAYCLQVAEDSVVQTAVHGQVTSGRAGVSLSLPTLDVICPAGLQWEPVRAALCAQRRGCACSPAAGAELCSSWLPSKGWLCAGQSLCACSSSR